MHSIDGILNPNCKEFTTGTSALQKYFQNIRKYGKHGGRLLSWKNNPWLFEAVFVHFLAWR
jgi:hypothetical protein